MIVRRTLPRDVPGLVTLSQAVYGERGAWKTHELHLHQEVFPEGQLVAVDRNHGELLGMAVSLVVPIRRWPLDASWREITDRGLLTTHDPRGDTLYGAGIAVSGESQGRGVGSALYLARDELCARLGLGRIRAGARIPGYRAVAPEITPEEYVAEVVQGLRPDPTLSFQLSRGFRVLGVARNYLRIDDASLGHAAVVEKALPEDER